MEKIKKFVNAKHPSWSTAFMISVSSVINACFALGADPFSEASDFYTCVACVCLFFLFGSIFIDKYFLERISRAQEEIIGLQKEQIEEYRMIDEGQRKIIDNYGEVLKLQREVFELSKNEKKEGA